MMTLAKVCPLCGPVADKVVWEDNQVRVLHVDDKNFPGFCRVVWREHITEMTDLATFDQRYLMEVVLTVERGLRTLLDPDKINLASFGNQVPHLHWHIVPRFIWDSHFPDAIWAAPKRDADLARVEKIREQANRLTIVLPAMLNNIVANRSS